MRSGNSKRKAQNSVKSERSRFGSFIEHEIEERIRVKRRLLSSCLGEIQRTAEAWVEALREGRRIYLFGNGGSAADAQHIAAELVGRFREKRRPLPVMALTTNSSSVTAIANDFGYGEVFVRPVEAFVEPGDVVVAISTSGRSANVIRALRAARRRGARTMAWTGQRKTALHGVAEVSIRVPSLDTPLIQECHGTIGHIVCDIVDRSFGGRDVFRIQPDAQSKRSSTFRSFGAPLPVTIR